MEMVLIVTVLLLVAFLSFGGRTPKVTVYNVTFDSETGMYDCLFLWHNEERVGCFELPEGVSISSLDKDDKFDIAGVDCCDGCCYLIREKDLK